MLVSDIFMLVMVVCVCVCMCVRACVCVCVCVCVCDSFGHIFLVHKKFSPVSDQLACLLFRPLGQRKEGIATICFLLHVLSREGACECYPGDGDKP